MCPNTVICRTNYWAKPRVMKSHDGRSIVRSCPNLRGLALQYNFIAENIICFVVASYNKRKRKFKLKYNFLIPGPYV